MNRHEKLLDGSSAVHHDHKGKICLRDENAYLTHSISVSVKDFYIETMRHNQSFFILKVIMMLFLFVLVVGSSSSSELTHFWRGIKDLVNNIFPSIYLLLHIWFTSVAWSYSLLATGTVIIS